MALVGYTRLSSVGKNLDTSDATGRLLFNMLGAIAQFETEIRSERQMDGVQKAKERGVKFGPQVKLNKQQVEETRQRRREGALIKDYKLSKASVYRYLKPEN